MTANPARQRASPSRPKRVGPAKIFSGAAAGVAACCAWAWATTGWAHPSPAEPPTFPTGDCIVVVDKREQSEVHIDYVVLVDDTAPEVDHVSLPDSKTHQFFAVEGTLLLSAEELFVLPFSDTQGLSTPLPTWLSLDDVVRTAAAVTPEDMTEFTEDQVEPTDILANDPVLSGLVRPLAEVQTRVPITQEQASTGIVWDVSAVPPGVYQIAGYIFSPPHNGWEPRVGLFKIVDSDDEATPEPAALTLNPVAARLFDGQGRRLSGCADGPEGSTLQLLARPRVDPPGAFEPWLSQTVDDGEFELCMVNPGLDAILELRLELRLGDTLLSAVQASDTLSLFSSAATCVNSDFRCCPEVDTTPMDAAVDAPDAASPAASSDAGALDGGGTRSDGNTQAPPADAGLAAEAVDAAELPADAQPPRTSGKAGCSCQQTPGAGGGAAITALWLWARRVRRRRTRTGSPTELASTP